jgi:predicted MFS family arabinose efflux permease
LIFPANSAWCELRRISGAAEIASAAIPPVLRIVSLVVFASTVFSRAVDPVIPLIATDLAIDVKTAALLSTAFTFPYALMQPALGTIADFFGKTRLMNVSLAVVAASTLVCAVSHYFPLIVGMRVVAGMMAGGVFPVALAIVGDLVPVNERQVAIGRVLAVGLTGNLIGASVSGVIGDLAGWRSVFFVFGGFGVVVTAIAYFGFRGLRNAPPKPFNLQAAAQGFQGVFADPRAKVCFGSVFFEGIFIHGMFPFVALLLLSAGQEHAASYAGIVIAGFGLGGIIYSLAMPVFVHRFRERNLMIAGGICGAICLTVLSVSLGWAWMAAVFVVYGAGFYMLHTLIQLHVTDLSHTARGAAMSLHSASFFFGQALGPVYYGFAFSHFGRNEPTLVGAVVILGVGYACYRLLRHRAPAPV